jgi:hypothetical protein
MTTLGDSRPDMSEKMFKTIIGEPQETLFLDCTSINQTKLFRTLVLFYENVFCMVNSVCDFKQRRIQQLILIKEGVECVVASLRRGI